MTSGEGVKKMKKALFEMHSGPFSCVDRNRAASFISAAINGVIYVSSNKHN